MSPSKENGRVVAREPNHGFPTAEAVRFLIGRVADRAMTYRYYHWDWGEALAMEGLWRAAEQTRTERYRAFVDHMLHGWIAHSPDPWYPDHVGPGRVLVEMGRAAGNTRFLSYARLLATHLVNLPRSRLGAVFHRPDLPDRAQMVWVDSLQTDAPFLCRLAVAVEDERWFDSAAQHVLGQINALQDPAAHLFHHHYDEETGRRNGIFWARGNGWALLGLTQCLELLPRAHPEYPAIARSLEALASAVVRYQDPTSSLWHTVIDNPETYLEGSASLMLSCCLMRAGRAGLLPLSLAEAGSRAWARLWGAVDANGVVQRVSSRTPPRSDAAAYNQRPVGGNYPWGQGAYLLAATTFLGS
jgi:unsaturated rhamnogalacturonyl hydrolase